MARPERGNLETPRIQGFPKGAPGLDQLTDKQRLSAFEYELAQNTSEMI